MTTGGEAQFTFSTNIAQVVAEIEAGLAGITRHLEGASGVETEGPRIGLGNLQAIGQRQITGYAKDLEKAVTSLGRQIQRQVSEGVTDLSSVRTDGLKKGLNTKTLAEAVQSVRQRAYNEIAASVRGMFATGDLGRTFKAAGISEKQVFEDLTKRIDKAITRVETQGRKRLTELVAGLEATNLGAALGPSSRTAVVKTATAAAQAKVVNGQLKGNDQDAKRFAAATEQALKGLENQAKGSNELANQVRQAATALGLSREKAAEALDRVASGGKALTDAERAAAISYGQLVKVNEKFAVGLDSAGKQYLIALKSAFGTKVQPGKKLSQTDFQSAMDDGAKALRRGVADLGGALREDAASSKRLAAEQDKLAAEMAAGAAQARYAREKSAGTIVQATPGKNGLSVSTATGEVFQRGASGVTSLGGRYGAIPQVLDSNGHLSTDAQAAAKLVSAKQEMQARAAADATKATEQATKAELDVVAALRRDASALNSAAAQHEKNAKEIERNSAAAARANTGVAGSFLSGFTSRGFGSNNSGFDIGGLAHSAGITAKYSLLSEALRAVQSAAAGAVQDIAELDRAKNEFDSVIGKGAATQGYINDLQNIGRAAGITASQLLDATFPGIAALTKKTDTQDQKRETGLAFAQAVQTNSIITNQTVQQSTQDVLAGASSFDLSANQLELFNNAIAHAREKTGADAGAISQALQLMGDTAKSTGFSLNELGQIFGQVNLRTGESGTAMAGSLQRILTELSSTSGLSNLRDMGINEPDAKHSLIAVAKKYNAPGTSNVQKAEIAAKFGGRNATRDLVPVLENIDTIQSDAKAADLDPGAADRQREAELKSLKGQLRELTTGFGNLASSIGQSGLFAPLGLALKAALPLVNALNSMLQIWNQMPGAIRGSVLMLGEFALAARLARTGALAGVASGAARMATSAATSVVGVAGAGAATSTASTAAAERLAAAELRATATLEYKNAADREAAVIVAQYGAAHERALLAVNAADMAEATNTRATEQLALARAEAAMVTTASTRSQMGLVAATGAAYRNQLAVRAGSTAATDAELAALGTGARVRAAGSVARQGLGTAGALVGGVPGIALMGVAAAAASFQAASNLDRRIGSANTARRDAALSTVDAGGDAEKLHSAMADMALAAQKTRQEGDGLFGHIRGFFENLSGGSGPIERARVLAAEASKLEDESTAAAARATKAAKDGTLAVFGAATDGQYSVDQLTNGIQALADAGKTTAEVIRTLAQTLPGLDGKKVTDGSGVLLDGGQDSLKGAINPTNALKDAIGQVEGPGLVLSQGVIAAAGGGVNPKSNDQLFTDELNRVIGGSNNAGAFNDTVNSTIDKWLKDHGKDHGGTFTSQEKAQMAQAIVDAFPLKGVDKKTADEIRKAAFAGILDSVNKALDPNQKQDLTDPGKRAQLEPIFIQKAKDAADAALGDNQGNVAAAKARLDTLKTLARSAASQDVGLFTAGKKGQLSQAFQTEYKDASQKYAQAQLQQTLDTNETRKSSLPLIKDPQSKQGDLIANQGAGNAIDLESLRAKLAYDRQYDVDALVKDVGDYNALIQSLDKDQVQANADLIKRYGSAVASDIMLGRTKKSDAKPLTDKGAKDRAATAAQRYLDSLQTTSVEGQKQIAAHPEDPKAIADAIARAQALAGSIKDLDAQLPGIPAVVGDTLHQALTGLSNDLVTRQNEVTVLQARVAKDQATNAATLSDDVAALAAAQAGLAQTINDGYAALQANLDQYNAAVAAAPPILPGQSATGAPGSILGGALAAGAGSSGSPPASTAPPRFTAPGVSSSGGGKSAADKAMEATNTRNAKARAKIDPRDTIALAQRDIDDQRAIIGTKGISALDKAQAQIELKKAKLALAQAKASLAEAQAEARIPVGDTVGEARQKLVDARDNLKLQLQGTQAYYEALKGVQQAQADYAQALIDAGAFKAISGLGVGDAVNIARINLTKSRMELGQLKKGTAEYYSKLVDVMNAQRDLANAILAQASAAAAAMAYPGDTLAAAQNKYNDAVRASKAAAAGAKAGTVTGIATPGASAPNTSPGSGSTGRSGGSGSSGSSRGTTYYNPAADKNGLVTPFGSGTSYRLTQHDGHVNPNIPYASGHHTGDDLAVPVGTKVYSRVSGKVVEAKRSGAWGNTVVVDLGNGRRIRYAHLSRIDQKVGDRVTPGELIGLSGNTGRSFGAHLHYEADVYRNGRWVDVDPKVIGKWAKDQGVKTGANRSPSSAPRSTQSATRASSSSSRSSNGAKKRDPLAGGTFAGIRLSAEQIRNARTIISVGKSMGMSDRDIETALMAAMQESSLRNLSGGDRDSVGLFQQRPSQGWGTPAQLHDPVYASKKFFQALKGVKGRNNMSRNDAAQKVQRSGTPHAYVHWQNMAIDLYGKQEGSASPVSTGGGGSSSGGSAGSAGSAGGTGAPASVPNISNPNYGYVTAKKGETEAELAKRSGITVAQLEAYNSGLKKNHKIKAGTRYRNRSAAQITQHNMTSEELQAYADEKQAAQEYAQAQINTAGARAEAAVTPGDDIGQAKVKMAEDIATLGTLKKGSQEYWQQVKTIREDQKAYADAENQYRSDVLMSRIDPRDAIGVARANLAVGLQKYKQAQTGDQKAQAAKDLATQTQAVLQAQYDQAAAHMEAGIGRDDAVGQAKARVSEARARIAMAEKGTAEYYQAVKDGNDALRDLQDAQLGLRNGKLEATFFSDDTLTGAKAKVTEANGKLATLQRGTQAWYEAIREHNDAIAEYANAVLDDADTKAALGSDVTDQVEEARLALIKAREKTLADQKLGKSSSVITADQLAEKQATASLEDAAFQQRMSTYQTDFDLKRISATKYLAALKSEKTRLEAIKTRTEQEQHELDSVDQAIQGFNSSMEGQFNLGDIKLPTVYNVRRYLAARDAANQQAQAVSGQNQQSAADYIADVYNRFSTHVDAADLAVVNLTGDMAVVNDSTAAASGAINILTDTTTGASTALDHFSTTVTAAYKTLTDLGIKFTGASTAIGEYNTALSKGLKPINDALKDAGVSIPTVSSALDNFGKVASKWTKWLADTLATIDATLNGKPVKKAAGGWVTGPGTTTSDSVPTLLSNREFVVNAAAAAKNRALLEAINSGHQVPAMLSTKALAASMGSSSAASVTQVIYNIQVDGADTAMVQRVIRQSLGSASASVWSTATRKM